MRRWMLLVLAVVVAGVAAGLVGGSAPAGSVKSRWVIADLGLFTPMAINGRGQIAGTSTTASGSVHVSIWQNGKMRDLGNLGGEGILAAAINDRGQVVGWGETADGKRHGFLWQKGRMIDLGTLPGDWGSEAVAINERGQIVGSSYSDENRSRPHAFLWENGRIKLLAGTGEGFAYSEALAINERGEVAGRSLWFGEISDWRDRAVVWRDAKPAVLGGLGGRRGEMASDINDRGQVVGVGNTPDDEFRALMWENGAVRDLGTLPGERDCSAEAINERGQIIGRCTDYMIQYDPDRAFLWQSGRIAPIVSGQSSTAAAINDRGQIVGRWRGAAFLWQNRKTTVLGKLPGRTTCGATAIDPRGLQILGHCDAKTGQQHAVLWTFKQG